MNVFERARRVGVRLRRYALPVMMMACIALASSGRGVAQTGHADTVFTAEQRNAIVAIVREALKSDPSILTDAIMAMRGAEEKRKDGDLRATLEKHREALQEAPDFAIRGNPHGDVTIVEFLDPRCGYCRAMVPVIDRLISGDSGLRVVERIVPVLSDKSVLATQAIYAASRQGTYDVMKRAVMQDPTAPDADRIRQLATANGVDAERLMADLRNPDVLGLINRNLAAARLVDLEGTPTFLFGTDSVAPGALSIEEMRRRIAAARHAGG